MERPLATSRCPRALTTRYANDISVQFNYDNLRINKAFFQQTVKTQPFYGFAMVLMKIFNTIRHNQNYGWHENFTTELAQWCWNSVGMELKVETNTIAIGGLKDPRHWNALENFDATESAFG